MSAEPAAGRGMGPALLSAVLLSAWIGAGLYFTAVVAQAAFRALPTRALAGALVGRTLPAVFIAGIVVGLAVAVLAWGEPASRNRLVRILSGVGVATLCALAQFQIGARIARLRVTIGTTLDALPPDNPMRAAFGRLHALSVAALAVAAILAVVALVAAYRQVLAAAAHDRPAG